MITLLEYYYYYYYYCYNSYHMGTYYTYHNKNSFTRLVRSGPGCMVVAGSQPKPEYSSLIALLLELLVE